jgi:SAM-dependent methyltransferase
MAFFWFMSASEIDYAAMAQRNPFYLKKIAPNIRDLLDILKIEDTLLDAGCGEGYGYTKFGHAKYSGIDIVEKHILRARKNNPGVRFEVGDIFNLKEKWDVVFCSRVLMHHEDYEGNIGALKTITERLLLVVIPIGQEVRVIEEHKGRYVQFDSYSRRRILETHPLRVRIHDPYATVIYDPSLS